MSTTLNATNTPNLLNDLDIVCQRRPGRGPAFSRLLDYAQVTQRQLAEAIGVDHSAVSHWISEKKNPSYANLRKALAFLQVDHALVVKSLGQLIKQDSVADVLRARLAPRTIQVTLDDLLKIYTDEDPDKREQLICRVVMEPITAAMAVKAMAGDVRAAQWMDGRQEKLEVRIRLKATSERKPQVSTRGQDYLSGRISPLKKPQSEAATEDDSSPSLELKDKDLS
jgi:transcriptional regulator with XRE-family HTH domain